MVQIHKEVLLFLGRHLSPSILELNSLLVTVTVWPSKPRSLRVCVCAVHDFPWFPLNSAPLSPVRPQGSSAPILLFLFSRDAAS